jgi:hypothetical protein
MKLLACLLLIVPLSARDGRSQRRLRRPPLHRRTPRHPAPPVADAPSGDSGLQGSTKVGYRCIPYISVDFSTYRSVVNLGEGHKMLELSLSSMNELYRVRGDSIYSKALLAANRLPWMSIAPDFVYAERAVMWFSPRLPRLISSCNAFSVLQLRPRSSDGRCQHASRSPQPFSGDSAGPPLAHRGVLDDRTVSQRRRRFTSGERAGRSPMTDQQSARDRTVVRYNQQEVDASYVQA